MHCSKTITSEMSAGASVSKVPGRAVRELTEVAVAYGLTEGALWSPRPAQLAWVVAAAGWVIWSTKQSSRSARELGITAAGMWQSWWMVGAATVTSGLIVSGACYIGGVHALQFNRPLWHALAYSLWALAQQFLVQSFVFVRLQSVFSDRTAIACTALLFSLAHIPNLVLMPATLVAGLVFSFVFRRYRNIYTLGLAHALLGLTLAVSLPETATHRMRVGADYGSAISASHSMFLVDRQQQNRSK
jgi:membrane protease YdiL (CAAX protease family)